MIGRLRLNLERKAAARPSPPPPRASPSDPSAPPVETEKSRFSRRGSSALENAVRVTRVRRRGTDGARAPSALQGSSKSLRAPFERGNFPEKGELGVRGEAGTA